MSQKLIITIFITLCCLQSVYSGHIACGVCQAGCALDAVACCSEAGAIFDLVPSSVIAASPELTACISAYAACYSVCSAAVLLPTP